MKKTIVIFSIVSLAIIVGCVTNQQQTTQTQKARGTISDSLLTITDLPDGFSVIKWRYIVGTNVTSCKINTCSPTQIGINDPIFSYQRIIGYNELFQDATGRSIVVSYKKFDSNDGIIGYIENNGKYNANIPGEEIGNPNIGERSRWVTIPNQNNPNFIFTYTIFTKNNYVVEIGAMEEKEQAFNDAINYAKKISSRI